MWLTKIEFARVRGTNSGTRNIPFCVFQTVRSDERDTTVVKKASCVQLALPFPTHCEHSRSPRPKNSPPDCFCPVTRWARASESTFFSPPSKAKRTSDWMSFCLVGEGAVNKQVACNLLSRSRPTANTAEVHALKTVHRTVFAPLHDGHGLPNPPSFPHQAKQKGHPIGCPFAWWGKVDSDHRSQ